MAIKLNYLAKLEELYEEAKKRLAMNGEGPSTPLSQDELQRLNVILKHAESKKGVLTVFITSAFYKLCHPEQDIRNHQQSLDNGYSGRGFDTHYITPFLKSKSFPAMAESGWLTRSLEQNSPYTLDYRGSITPADLKAAFLESIDAIENGADSQEYILFILQSLMLLRDAQDIRLAKPTDIPISTIIRYLNAHFSSSYSASGAARLPVLAIYSSYQCLMSEVDRFDGKTLLTLESHTASDVRSGKIGDIQVNDGETAYEAVEVKHGIPISLQMVKDAYTKFSSEPVKRYYILSTAGLVPDEKESIEAEIERVKDIHGCQLIVNGVLDTVKYYLRLLNDPSVFSAKYAENLEADGALKFEHKQKWNEIVGG